HGNAVADPHALGRYHLDAGGQFFQNKSWPCGGLARLLLALFALFLELLERVLQLLGFDLDFIRHYRFPPARHLAAASATTASSSASQRSIERSSLNSIRIRSWPACPSRRRSAASATTASRFS